MKQQEASYLLKRYLNGATTIAEKEKIELWYKELQEDFAWELPTAERAAVQQRLKAAIDKNKNSRTNNSIHRIHLLRTAWLRYAAAIILLLGVAAYFWSSRSGSGERSQTILASQGAERSRSADIPPATNKAILTLASGKKIILDNNSNGQLIQPDGVEVSTPNGGQYQVILPDGTKVWLNSASSIKFPTAFTGKERKVEITGEAYFEVNPTARSAKKRLSPFLKGDSREAAGGYAARQPFILTANGTSIQVLGTTFNVNAYTDESTIKTSLLEGSIKVSTGPNNIILKPGQQAIVPDQSNTIKIKEDIDIQDAVAWKNGLFVFNEIGIEPIMRQLARWYNVEVTYKGKVNTTFLSTIPRNVPLSQVLEALELTKKVHFEINGNQITVTPG